MKPMQSYVEKYLIDKLACDLKSYQLDTSEIPEVLNIGAGESTVIEKHLFDRGVKFICDRVDVELVKVQGFSIRNCYHCSIESMPEIRSETYRAAYSNFVLEHVEKLDKAASEIERILKPGGIFIANVPNPTAIETVLARITPLRVHKLIRGGHAWETHFSYKNIEELRDIFQTSGLKVKDIVYRSSMISYMRRFIILNFFARVYDDLLNSIYYPRFMNHVCLIFEKRIDAGS
jgi:SAM-dependent methyltransferase